MKPPRDWEQEYFWKHELLQVPKREKDPTEEVKDEDESEE